MHLRKDELEREIEELKEKRDQKANMNEYFTGEYSKFNQMNHFEVQNQMAEQIVSINRISKDTQKKIKVIQNEQVEVFKLIQNMKQNHKNLQKKYKFNDEKMMVYFMFYKLENIGE